MSEDPTDLIPCVKCGLLSDAHRKRNGLCLDCFMFSLDLPSPPSEFDPGGNPNTLNKPGSIAFLVKCFLGLILAAWLTGAAYSTYFQTSEPEVSVDNPGNSKAPAEVLPSDTISASPKRLIVPPVIKGLEPGDRFYDSTRYYLYKSNQISFHHTRQAAIQALAAQFEEPVEWVAKNMGRTNSILKIHDNLVQEKLKEGKGILLTQTGDSTGAASASNAQSLQRGKSQSSAPASVGIANHSIIRTFKEAWRRDDMRNRSREMQSAAITIMILGVQSDIPDPEDQKAILDYIQRTIDTW